MCVLEPEVLSDTILETMATRLPSMATRVGGIPEIGMSPKFGTLVARKPKHVAKALKTSLECTWSKSEILNYAQHFQWSWTADVVREVFQSVFPIQKSAKGMPFSSGL